MYKLKRAFRYVYRTLLEAQKVGQILCFVLMAISCFARLKREEFLYQSVFLLEEIET